MKHKVVIALNAAWNLVNFRSGLIRALVKAGYEVVAVAPLDEYVERLADLGCRYVPLPMDNRGTHPGRDVLLFWRYRQLMKRERPLCFLGYTVKPNVYGSIAAHSLGIPVINNISGLGTAFMNTDWLNQIVCRLYRLALSRSVKVFFQNDDDLRTFVQQGLVNEVKTGRLPGSGIDLNRFQPSSIPVRDETVFLLCARMLWDKGVGEFVEAARIVRAKYPVVRFQLLGFLGVPNRTAIPEAVVYGWVEEGVVEYLGSTDDVRPHMAVADCIVLPSYREGTPRSLLEGAALGRPIIASDAAGCRDVVDEGQSGYLCQPRDVQSLVEQFEKFLALSPDSRQLMGQRGREKMEREFDERLVIDRYLELIAVEARRSQVPSATLRDFN